MTGNQNIYDLTYDDLVPLMREMGQKAYRATQLHNWLYKKRAGGFEEMTNIPAKFREQIEANFNISLPEISKELLSEDGSRKFLLQLADSERIESVLIPHDERNTLCISSQVGCKLGCKFCATAKMGFRRDLSPGEITGQLMAVERRLGIVIDNIVVMGMGEPLDNLENLLKALDIFTRPEALAMSPKRITVSTAGIPKAMVQLKHRFPKVGLSLSLNAPDHFLRTELMPIEETHPMGELIAVIKKIDPGPQDPVTIEYVLLKDINDSPEQAVQLANLFSGIHNVKVNLIAFNPVKGIPYESPSRETVERFQSNIRRKGFECFIRRSAGRDISAACGQLISEDIP
jgi:23S rRNA (adenine2503-C2)-methyltransferase